MAAWQEIAQEAQRHRDDTINAIKPPLPPLPNVISHNVIDVPRQLLSHDELVITETPTIQLLQSLSTGKVTATAVAKAFLRRAAVAQKLVNCIFELLPDRALARAKELDDLREGGGPIGPLHGLPISVKTVISMKGLRKGGGFTDEYTKVCQDDAEVLKILWNAGAVFYARTTEPQALMMIETSSYVTGITTNPHNTATTCGGSSGGEAALIALHGSPLGIGGDIGGSVRSPAGNCGIYALKPSRLRIPGRGVSYFMSSSETIRSTQGPMSSTLDGIKLFMKTVLGSEPWKRDLSLHPLPWRDAEPYFLQPDGRHHINVGVIWDDGVVKPVAPITRALREVVNKLKALDGFTVTEWHPYQHDRGMKILEKLYAPDGGRALLEACNKTGEPVHPLISYRMLDGPGVEDLPLHSIWKWTKERETFVYDYFEEWRSKAPEMDVILCPYLPSPAPLLETTRYWGYLSIWNLLDYPAVVFPVTKIDPERDAEPSDYIARNEADEWNQKHYDVLKQRDLPVSLQLVGKRLEEEKVVRALELITSATGLPFKDWDSGTNDIESL